MEITGNSRLLCWSPLEITSGACVTIFFGRGIFTGYAVFGEGPGEGQTTLMLQEADIDNLETYKESIDIFLKENLQLDLHATKSKILLLKRGILFLGFRNFPYHKLLRKANIRTIGKKIIQKDYDSLCEFLEGWMAYASHANTYNLRRKITNTVEANFQGNISLLQIDRLIKYSEAT